MRNKFAGTCYRCGKLVLPEKGQLSYLNFPGSTWPQLRGWKVVTLIQHDDCAKEFAGTDIHYVYKPSLPKE